MRKKLAAAVANTAVAALLTGPAGGLGEAARQLIDLTADGQPRLTSADILKRLRRDLEAFAAGENLSDSFMDQAFATAQPAIRRGGVSVAECLDLRLDPQRIANRVLGRASDLLGDTDDGVADICRRIVHRVYREVLADPRALPELEREFQRHVVSALVRAEFAVVPFHARAGTLAELDDWCAQGPDAAFRLYTGAGGMGTWPRSRPSSASGPATRAPCSTSRCGGSEASGTGARRRPAFLTCAAGPCLRRPW